MTEHDRLLLRYLLDLLTPKRRARLAQVLSRRTRHLTLVLEDVHIAHNISAVLRSCDAFGLQDVHIVEAARSFEANAEIALGAQQWITIHRHRATPDAPHSWVTPLRARGYRIVATSPHAANARLHELDVSAPLALVFGEEKEGLSDATLAAADLRVAIPMFGFVESLNISVAAAICLQHLSTRLRQTDVPWQLTEAEKEELLLDWARASVPHVQPIEERFRQSLVAGAGLPPR